MCGSTRGPVWLNKFESAKRSYVIKEGKPDRRTDQDGKEACERGQKAIIQRRVPCARASF